MDYDIFDIKKDEDNLILSAVELITDGKKVRRENREPAHAENSGPDWVYPGQPEIFSVGSLAGKIRAWHDLDDNSFTATVKRGYVEGELAERIFLFLKEKYAIQQTRGRQDMTGKEKMLFFKELRKLLR
jgi:hypothetical protein